MVITVADRLELKFDSGLPAGHSKEETMRFMAFIQ